MKIDDLYKIINLENHDSEIVAMRMVVEDSNSGKRTKYTINSYGGIEMYNV